MTSRLKPGVVSGQSYKVLIQHCKSNNMALPAINVTNGCALNAAMEGAAKSGSDIIIQISGGGAQFFAGKHLSNALSASVIGAQAMAQQAHLLAEHYGICVVLHTDHANRKLLPWVDGLLDVGEVYFKAHGKPLYTSHMIDLSDEPLDANMAECEPRLKRMNAIGMSLEFELGVTGGEEDGVGKDLDEVDNDDLYTNPEQVLEAYNQLSPLGAVTVAAAFGNVHGVYKPGNVVLRPKLLRDIQALVQEKNRLSENALDFVFHGGSGSAEEDIREAISYGVFKINVDTDTQFAFANGVGRYVKENSRAFEMQFDADTGEVFKNQYDPRKWLRAGETSVAEKVAECCKIFGSAGKSIAMS